MKLPDDISLDFAPTPQTLWACWGKTSEDALKSGWSTTPVWFSWSLASAGEAGLAEIRKSMPTQFLAAVPFEHILNAQSLLDTMAKPQTSSWLPKWLGGASTSFMLIDEGKTGIRWAFGNSKQASGKVLAEGEISDFTALVEEGRQIISGNLYKKIQTDERPVAPGHPYDWLVMMQSPEACIKLRVFLNEKDD